MADWQASDGLTYYRSPLLTARAEVVHGFFTRQGGVSPGAYDSLNVSLAVGDGREPVAANLRRIQQALGLKALAGAAQVHGGRAAVITSADQARQEDIPEVDILVTTVPGLGLLIKQADCQAVMFYDPVNRVVANVHCGWRGQVQNILKKTVQLLKDRFATRPARPLCRGRTQPGPLLRRVQEFPPGMAPTPVDLSGAAHLLRPLAAQPGSIQPRPGFRRPALTWPASAPAVAPPSFTPTAATALPVARGLLSP